jgi:hypothetical protein
VTPEDVPEVVFSGKPHRLTMGLRPLDMDTWLDPDPQDRQMGLRRELLATRRDEVFGAQPGSESACRRVAAAVADRVGDTLPGRDHPLVEAAGMVRDDLCVLTRTDLGWVLAAGVVCFPSRWRLADKLGRDVLAIHDPVPRYRQQLGRPTSAVFDTITERSPRWRVNWTILDDPALFQPVAPSARTHRPGPDSYLRVERQCLVRVGPTVVFSIRTTVRRIADLAETQARAVLDAAATTPDDLAAYRGWK